MAKRKIRWSRNKIQISYMRLISLFGRHEEIGSWSETGSFNRGQLLLPSHSPLGGKFWLMVSKFKYSRVNLHLQRLATGSSFLSEP